ncbi:sensor domain-containing protein [Leucothrix pacifica]|uniref:GGDEF domain-containing protein n=1 Tax=Leucothrix pacifica TaxID=1247513 RepID=A0A317CS65_9GAMM|nr:EAL domain-containing protein [Leucothrix pacifica]PWR00384.1 GGDEF domain-containing protein [Leucothrix pacifica]
MRFFDSLSLRSRFLIAPFIGVVLTLIFFYSSNAIIQTHSDILREIDESNLPQIGEISRTVILLSHNHEKLERLLRDAEDDPDEERIYVEGRVILDELHELEEQLINTLRSIPQTISNIQIFKQIEANFGLYRDETINTIELSTREPELAEDEMHNAVEVLWRLNDDFMTLSDFHVQNLNEKSGLIESSLYDKSSLTILTSSLLGIMIFSALYFSRRMSSEIDLVNEALIGLARGDKDVKLPAKSNASNNMHQLNEAVYTFKRSLEKNKEQQHQLNNTIGKLTSSKEHYYNLLHRIPAAITAINDKGEIVLFNKAAEAIYGHSSREVIGQPMSMLAPKRVHDDNNHRFNEIKLVDDKALREMVSQPLTALKKNGEEFYVEAAVTKLTLANEESVMAFAITDVTNRIKAEREILHKAHYDALTQLPNRFLALDLLQSGLEEAHKNHETLAVFFLDLDGFKKINDTLGHETGDKLLIEAGKRLQSILNEGDTVARLGGDEFIVILQGLKTCQEAIPTVEELLEQFRTPFDVDDRELILTSSVGIATFPDDGDSTSELLRKADSAMYSAKKSGRNTYTFFTESMNRGVSRELALEEQLHGALKRNEFRLVFQPQIDVVSGTIVGAEALLRWHNHLLGDISPEEFIPIAEHTGLIIPIGEFVLTSALQAVTQWQAHYGSELRIAVNLSPRQFRDPNLIDFIKSALNRSGVSASTLELEITEGVLMSGHSFIDEALQDLSELGIRLAMDDFGTGYSSLSYLRRYSFDTLKIDRSFIKDISVSTANRELVTAIIAMGHALGLEIVAEGVECTKQQTFLCEHQCQYAQGYLFNRPMNADDVTEALSQQSTSAQAKSVQHSPELVM